MKRELPLQWTHNTHSAMAKLEIEGIASIVQARQHILLARDRTCGSPAASFCPKQSSYTADRRWDSFKLQVIHVITQHCDLRARTPSPVVSCFRRISALRTILLHHDKDETNAHYRTLNYFVQQKTFLSRTTSACFLGVRRGRRTPKHFVNLMGGSKHFKMSEFPLNQLKTYYGYLSDLLSFM
jgi:hypothetical protein